MVGTATVGTDTGIVVTADMTIRAATVGTATGMVVTATVGTLTRTLITITTIMGTGTVAGGMVVGGPMASAPAGVGHRMVMSGSAGTDYPLRPSGLPSTMSRQSRLLRIQYAAITAMKNDMRSAMHAVTASMVA
jgi:hypothetical protein